MALPLIATVGNVVINLLAAVQNDTRPVVTTVQMPSNMGVITAVSKGNDKQWTVTAIDGSST